MCVSSFGQRTLAGVPISQGPDMRRKLRQGTFGHLRSPALLTRTDLSHATTLRVRRSASARRNVQRHPFDDFAPGFTTPISPGLATFGIASFEISSNRYFQAPTFPRSSSFLHKSVAAKTSLPTRQ